MKILLVGASGVIGRAIYQRLSPHHDVRAASKRSCELKVDLANPNSIRTLLEHVGPLDAIISAAGEGQVKPVLELTDLDFHRATQVQLMGQINLFRFGLPYLRTGGSITLTSGMAALHDFPGASAIAMACAGLNRFVQAAAAELNAEDIRLNVVSPVLVRETLVHMGLPPHDGLSADDTAKAYETALLGTLTGAILNPVDVAHSTIHAA